jgi:hypothetical protein
MIGFGLDGMVWQRGFRLFRRNLFKKRAKKKLFFSLQKFNLTKTMDLNLHGLRWYKNVRPAL